MMRVILFALIALSVGCTHALHISNVADIQPLIRTTQAKRVKAEAEQFVVMGFVTQTDYVNAAFKQLEDSCPKGVVTGINTRYSTSHGFFSWTNKINMTAWCVN